MQIAERLVSIEVGTDRLEGSLALPDGCTGVVLFAHGSGSSRHSPRNRQVAAGLQQAGLATLLVDLLTQEEERIDRLTAHVRFDIPMLAARLVEAVRWLRSDPETSQLRIGCFGASTGTGAALIAAAELPEDIAAVVSRGGRPDLAGTALGRVQAPTLLIVGGRDAPVIDMNRDALAMIGAEKRLEIVPGATHLFEEPGTLEQVEKLAATWFNRYLSPDLSPDVLHAGGDGRTESRV